MKKHDLSKIVYHTVELGALNFGLTPITFQVLVEHVNLNIHNAWKVDFTQSLSSFEKLSADIKIFNLVHPQLLPWAALIETLVHQFGIDFMLVSLREWVGVLHASTNLDTEDVAAKPAVRLLGFSKH